MDFSLAHALNRLALHHAAFERALADYVRASELLFLTGVVLLFLLGPAAGRRAAVSAGAAAAVALLVAKIVSVVVDRPRPFTAHSAAIHALIPHAADPGFPSDHATAAFAIATTGLLVGGRWGVPVLIAAAVLAVGRVVLGVHYPSDVLAGALLGAVAALAVRRPPVADRLDRIADRLGRPLDRVLRRAAPSRASGAPGCS